MRYDRDDHAELEGERSLDKRHLLVVEEVLPPLGRVISGRITSGTALRRDQRPDCSAPHPAAQWHSSAVPTFSDKQCNYKVFRPKAEGYKLSRKARIKPFKTFLVSTTFGSIREDSSLDKKSKRFDGCS